jgi:hypothetical protein
MVLEIFVSIFEYTIVAFHSNGPIENKDSAKENTPAFFSVAQTCYILNKLNFYKCFHLNRAANDNRNGLSHTHPKRSKR